MAINWKEIPYKELNSRQKEIYNFQKVSGVLAEFGYLTIRLSDDWSGADFIAQHFKTKDSLKVQLKGRLTFDKQYHDRDLYICFRDGDSGPWYMYNHLELLERVLKKIEITKSWKEDGLYHFPVLSTQMRELLEPCRIPMTTGRSL